MEQQIQQGQEQSAQTKPGVQQAAGEQTQPAKKKKPKWWIWLIIAVVLIGVGVGLYFLGKYFNLF